MADAPKVDYYISWPLLKLLAEKTLPGSVYLCIRHKMVRYRNEGDTLDVPEYDKLLMNQVKYVFIEESKKAAFLGWVDEAHKVEREETLKDSNPDQVAILETSLELRRSAMDLFESPRGDDQTKASIQVSRKLVSEFLKKPYVINNITQMQRYGRGAVDHSVNVSVLSVFIGLRMGYSSQVILEHLAMGGLLHDLGKTLMGRSEEGMVDEDDPAYQQHPQLGKEALDNSKEIANEVKMIVAQHHEYLDGSGYPNKLRGLAIYDLARVVAIANIYDNLVSQSTGNIKERAAQALDRLEKEYADKLDPKKLEKAIKIIKYSLA